MLYKYLPIQRRDLFETGLVRFTQPGDFNDPFELHPSYDLMSRADIAALPEAPGQENVTGPKTRILTADVMQAMIAAVLPGLQKQIAEHAGQDGTFLLDNNKLSQATYDSKLGILSLTEDPCSVVMWAHYANNHNGIVVQFDERHDFFAATPLEGHTVAMSRVEYSRQRPILSYSTIHSPAVYFRKSPEWSYEREWRLVRLLSDAAKVLPHSEYPICLFEVPPSAITGVIIGVAVSHQARVELFDLLSQPKWKHVTVFQTALSKNDYALEVHPPLSGQYPPASFVVCEARDFRL